MCGWREEPPGLDEAAATAEGRGLADTVADTPTRTVDVAGVEEEEGTGVL